MAAQASPTRAKATYITGVMVLARTVSRKPARKQAASRITPAWMVRFRPNLEAAMPMGI